jgi:murein DD-endopeptidase MepM/ murein hydrolase activator NlpD
MRRWQQHRTRSKVALLLLINLLTLLGGRYPALITVLKGERLADPMALAQVPNKKLPTSGRSRTRDDGAPPPTTRPMPASLDDHQRRPPQLWHVIHPGETLAAIAAAYGVGVEALRRANELGPRGRVSAGEALRIPLPAAPQDIAAPTQSLTAGDGARLPRVPPERERRTPPVLRGRPRFIWPVGGTLTSAYGKRDHVMGGGVQFHAGVDLRAPTGTPVLAAQDGLVVFAGYHGAYGNAVKLEHRQGFATLYAHNARLLVHVGQTVKAGQVIGLSGSTGRSTGPHVHFEVHRDGWPVDPLPYLR